MTKNKKINVKSESKLFLKNFLKMEEKSIEDLFYNKVSQDEVDKYFKSKYDDGKWQFYRNTVLLFLNQKACVAPGEDGKGGFAYDITPEAIIFVNQKWWETDYFQGIILGTILSFAAAMMHSWFYQLSWGDKVQKIKIIKDRAAEIRPAK